MIYDSRTYNALVVSSAPKFTTSLMALLPESKFDTVYTVDNISSAKRAILEREYDFVLINTPLPDDFGTRFAIDCVNRSAVCVLLFVSSDSYAQVYSKVVDLGVYTLSKPASIQSVSIALDWMAATRERLRKFESKTTSIEEKMKEIRFINRAKWLLIDRMKMTESDAHRYIEKQAMDRCISKREICDEIIKTYN